MTTATVQQKLFQQGSFAGFLEFHRDYPQVYQEFADRAVFSFRMGKKMGARCIWETIRWEAAMGIIRDGRFTLNNNHVPYYARLVMLRQPALRGLFERRDAKFDATDAELLREANRIDQERMP